jgi:hypothetical protein
LAPLDLAIAEVAFGGFGVLAVFFVFVVDLDVWRS